MNTTRTVDLKAFLANSISEVFDMMLSMEVELSDEEMQEHHEGRRFVGSVGFVGSITGTVNIHIDEAFARIMAAAMLDIEIDEIDGDEMICDVLGETSNMVGGNIKSNLCDSGFPCKLSIPFITRGNNYRIGIRKWARHERFIFRHQQHAGLIEVYIKS